MNEPRLLDPTPTTALQDHVDRGGGRGIEAARRMGPTAVVEEVEASGLRGRGGAGFPTGLKWRTVAAHEASDVPTTVVVNAAEGEPGSFKDRAILRINPYRVLEGALIAAFAVGADRVIVATKASFRQEMARVRAAIDEVVAAGWADGIELEVVGGPGEYLYGEETALLEVLAGRGPFPRIAPPYRRGVDEVGVDDTSSAAGTQMASADDAMAAPPTLANNVETLANVPGILAEGPHWFRRFGTAESPGTIVCTVSGDVTHAGVGEVPMGTPLRAAVDEIGGGPRSQRRLVAVMSGVANPLVPAAQFDTPLTYEDMRAIGSGLGAAGFVVFDDATDLVAVAHGVSRFLSVESCGQCVPCKQDGLAMAELLDRIRRSEGREPDLADLDARLDAVIVGARCFLAQQHQNVVGSVVRLFPEALRGHVEARLEGVEPYLVAPIVDLVDGRAVLDVRQASKQPDWTWDEVFSGQSPADRLAQPRGLT